MTSNRNLGPRIAAGRTADIHRWSEIEVVKLYQPWMPRAAVEHERRNTLAAKDSGLPVPQVGEIIDLNGRTGLIMEFVQGVSMMRRIEEDPHRAASYAQRLAELHVALNAMPAPADLPGQGDVLRGKIERVGELADTEREVVLAALSRLPAGDRLCHGDFHPGNILMDRERTIIIDWIDASRGNPAADPARSSIIFLGHIALMPANPVRGQMEEYHRIYLQTCLIAAGIDREEYETWLWINAAARLGEGIPEFQDWLLARVRAGIEQRG